MLEAIDASVPSPMIGRFTLTCRRMLQPPSWRLNRPCSVEALRMGGIAVEEVLESGGCVADGDLGVGEGMA